MSVDSSCGYGIVAVMTGWAVEKASRVKSVAVGSSRLISSDIDFDFFATKTGCKSLDSDYFALICRVQGVRRQYVFLRIVK